MKLIIRVLIIIVVGLNLTNTVLAVWPPSTSVEENPAPHTVNSEYKLSPEIAPLLNKLNDDERKLSAIVERLDEDERKIRELGKLYGKDIAAPKTVE